MMKLVIVGVGGFIGSVLRYLLSGLVYRFFSVKPWLPYGTLFVNISGCFLIGFIGGLVDDRQMMRPELRLFVMIGLLGGFTTYSTFAYESFAYLRDAELLPFLLNNAAHVILGLIAVWLGYVFSQTI